MKRKRLWTISGHGATTPYRTALRLWKEWRLHIFWRGDEDPNPHDHPNDFWTFPLIGYWERVFDLEKSTSRLNYVKPWRWHFRPAEYAHRVLGAHRGDTRLPSRFTGRFVTIIIQGADRRHWVSGFGIIARIATSGFTGEDTLAKKAETRRQQNIKKKLKAECGGKWWKVHGSSFQEAGQPDIDGVCEAISFKFEVKEPFTGAPSDIQLQTLIEWREVGCIACIVETADQAIALVRAAIRTSANRHRGDHLYRWICRTLRAAFGEDMGYGRSTRGGKKHNPRRSARWASNQLKVHLGEVPARETTLVLGAP